MSVSGYGCHLKGKHGPDGATSSWDLKFIMRNEEFYNNCAEALCRYDWVRTHGEDTSSAPASAATKDKMGKTVIDSISRAAPFTRTCHAHAYVLKLDTNVIGSKTLCAC